MTAIQHEIGMKVVVKSRRRPFVAVVTRAALIAESAFVHIVFPMAVRTAIFGIVESIARMAGTTSNGRVQAGQGEGGQVMVESNRLPPCLLRMALQTIFAELARVRIVHGMASATTVRY